MTHHAIRITDHFAALIQRGAKTAELRYDDRDFQTGDTLNFCHNDTGEARRYMETRTITHVLKNFRGLEAGFVVLSLNDPEHDYLVQRRAELVAERDRLRKSNASLRGQITKLRKRMAS